MKKLFVLGDSISIYYGPYLEKYLNGFMEYDRKGKGADPGDLNLGSLQNGGDSSNVLEYVKENADTQFDVMLLNCGLHDIKTVEGRQVGEEQYKENLTATIKILQNRGKQIVWVSTTPVDDDRHQRCCSAFSRFNKDVIRYNEIATEIMNENSIPIIDLYNFTCNLDMDLFKDHVHFLDPVCALQAAHIAGALLAMV